MKPWPLSLGPGFGMKHTGICFPWKGLCPTRCWRASVEVSASTDLPKNALASLSQRNHSVPPRKVLYIAVDLSPLNAPIPRGETHHLYLSVFYPLLQIFQFPSAHLSKKVSLQEEEIHISPNCSAAGAPLTCCFFPKPFPAHSWPSSPARVSAAYSAQTASRSPAAMWSATRNWRANNKSHNLNWCSATL